MSTPILDLNLSTRPFRNNTWLWLGYGLLAGAIVWMTFWNVRSYTEHAGELASLRDQLATFDARMTDLRARDQAAEQGIRTHDLEVLEVQSKKANDVIALKAFSWTMLFNRLEGVLPYEVRMTSIRPVFVIGRTGRTRESEDGRRAVPVKVDGIAKSLQAFLEFQGNLLESPYFDRVEPERYERQPNEELQFTLEFAYDPAISREGDGAVDENAADVASAEEPEGPFEEEESGAAEESRDAPPVATANQGDPS